MNKAISARPKSREFHRLGLAVGGVVMTVLALNALRFGDFYSVRDCLALRSISCISSIERSSGSASEIRTDHIKVRNLTLSPVRVFSLLNSCGPVLGVGSIKIPPFGEVQLIAWEKASTRVPAYRLYHGLGDRPLEIRVSP